MAIDFSAEIERLEHTYSSIAAVTDPQALRVRIDELSEKAAAPDLWFKLWEKQLQSLN